MGNRKKIFSINNMQYTVLKATTICPKDQMQKEVLVALHKIGCCSGVFQNIIYNWDFESLKTTKDFKAVYESQGDWDSCNGSEILENGESLVNWIADNYAGWQN